MAAAVMAAAAAAAAADADADDADVDDVVVVVIVGIGAKSDEGEEKEEEADDEDIVAARCCRWDGACRRSGPPTAPEGARSSMSMASGSVAAAAVMVAVLPLLPGGATAPPAKWSSLTRSLRAWRWCTSHT